MSHEQLFTNGVLRDEGIFGPPNDILQRLSGFAHIEDDAEREAQIARFSRERLGYLVVTATPQNYFMTYGNIEEFIHPESVIENYQSPVQSMFFKTGLRLDDDEVYPDIAHRAVALTRSGLLQGAPLTVTVPFAVVGLVHDYFGSTSFDTEGVYRKNTDFSQSGTMSIKEYRGKGIAVCAQVAPLTHNLIRFLGYDSTLVYSLENQFDGEEVAHVYNLFRTPQGVTLYDSPQPGAVFDEEGKYLGEFPALYPLTIEQAETIKSGGNVEVVHRNVILTNEGKFQLKDDPEVRLYSGT